MNDRYSSFIAAELSLPIPSVNAAVGLLEEEATIPFIARYRKEATGNLDEVALMSIRDRLAQLKELDSRRAAILKSLDERKLLTPALTAAVMGAQTLAKLEDIYLPYRPKKRTRAMIAKEKGLEPLADASSPKAMTILSSWPPNTKWTSRKPSPARATSSPSASPRMPPRAPRSARSSSPRARSTPRS